MLTASSISPHNASPVSDLDTVSPRARAATARRIVIKVGTNVVMRDDGRPALARLYALAESIAALRWAHRDVVLVSSGAIGLGAQRLGLTGTHPAPSDTLARKQACAAVGQGRLMGLYADAFDRLDIVSAQVLLTEDDFADEQRYRNLRATLTTLLDIGAVPIVNENDTVSTLELERDDARTRAPIFGDNDKLSALIAEKVGADLLVLLSDVDGLYTGNPTMESGSSAHTPTLIPVVERITPEILAVASGGNTRGRGGMATKLDAARIATSAGVCTVIANGRTPHVIDHICQGAAIGTVFLPESAR